MSGMTETARTTFAIDEWADLSASEISFWDRWIGGGGAKWPEDFKRRTDPEAPLTELVVNTLPRLDLAEGQTLRILDIGSGPLSFVGYKYDDHPIDLTIVDPLADRYNELLDQGGVTGVPRPRTGYFESALSDFGEASFDLVWCFNSLDHSIDPLVGLYNLLMLVRPGGGLILGFHPNEADGGNYQGLHQWNLDVDGEDGALLLTRYGKVARLQNLLSQQTVLSCHVPKTKEGHKSRVTIVVRKDAPCNLSEAMLA